MNWWQSIILGLVQGLTEFLPVSSSGHLTIAKELLGVEASQDLVFEVAVHAATVLATIIVFRKQIGKLLCGFFKFKNNDEMDYVLRFSSLSFLYSSWACSSRTRWRCSSPLFT